MKGRTERGAVRLAEQLDHVLTLVAQVINQAQRRVIQGETVPANEKLVSLFEPVTQIIKWQKPGTPVEFGGKLWLEEVEGGIVSGYRVLDHPGQDSPESPQSLADHQRRFGKPPWLVAGDRGVFSPAKERLATVVVEVLSKPVGPAREAVASRPGWGVLQVVPSPTRWSVAAFGTSHYVRNALV